MNNTDIPFIKFLNILGENLKKDAVVDKISKNSNENERAFKILVSTVISARTNDGTTAKDS